MLSASQLMPVTSVRSITNLRPSSVSLALRQTSLSSPSHGSASFPSRISRRWDRVSMVEIRSMYAPCLTGEGNSRSKARRRDVELKLLNLQNSIGRRKRFCRKLSKHLDTCRGNGIMPLKLTFSRERGGYAERLVTKRRSRRGRGRTIRFVPLLACRRQLRRESRRRALRNVNRKTIPTAQTPVNAS